MHFPPYPPDGWERWRIGALLVVAVALFAGSGRRPVRVVRRPVVVEREEPAPWFGCCRARPEL